MEWIDSINWIGYAMTDEHEQVYTLACFGDVGPTAGCEFYCFTSKWDNQIMESCINIITNIASMNYEQDRITNVKIRFGEDSNIRQFFTPLITRIEKLNKLEKDDERLSVCDIATEEGSKLMKKFNIDIFDVLREGRIRFVDDPEHRN